MTRKLSSESEDLKIQAFQRHVYSRASILQLAIEFHAQPSEIRSWIESVAIEMVVTDPKNWVRLCDRCLENPRKEKTRLCQDCLDCIHEERELDANDQTYCESNIQLEE